MVGRTTHKSSSKIFYVPFTPLLRLQLTGCLLLNWFLSGQAGFSRYWWSRRSNAQNLCYHLATGVPTAIQNFLTDVPTCSRMYLQLCKSFSRVYLRAHGCTFPVLEMSEMSEAGLDDWEEEPAELEPPEAGWPWNSPCVAFSSAKRLVTPAASRSSAQNVVGHQQGSLKRHVSRRTSHVSLLEGRLEGQTSVVLARISYLSKSLNLWARLHQPWTHQ